jgi:hypothetical protein
MRPSVSTGGHSNNKEWDPGRREEKDRLGVIGVSEGKVKGMNSRRNRPSLKMKGTLQGKPCEFLIDSGATGDFVSSTFIERYHLDSRCKDLASPLTVEVADGSVCTSSRVMTGVVMVDQDKELNCRCDLLVLPLSGYDAILGMPWLEDVNPDIDWEVRTIRPRLRCDAVKKTQDSVNLEPLTESDKARLQESLIGVDADVVELVNRYADIFREDLPSGLPMSRPIEHSIPLVDGAGPVYLKQYRLSGRDQTEVDRQVQEHLLAGRIRRSVSPFNAPTLLVDKPDGSQRMCQDERGLNKVTVKNRITMPQVQEMFDRLKGCGYLSKLDLKQGFNQIRIVEEDIHKTGFSCSTGHYEWLVMPFGLCNAPATFQSLMQYILEENLNKFVVVFIDDILIFSKTKEDHLKQLEWVLQQLQKWQLYAAAKKCCWMKPTMEFLGHVVSADGVQVMQKKIQAIAEWPELSTSKEVKQFLGLAGYYRRFVKEFSKIAAPLTELSKEKTVWRWGKEEKEAFNQLKSAMSNTPVLIHPDVDKAFTVTTDASGYAVGAMLSQDQGNGQQPVAFFSHKMSNAERRYPVHEQELLAILLALKEWRCYLHGSSHPITVVTDHMSLKYINSQPHLSNRQARWVEYLQQFDLTISYREGKDNVVADALSRRGDFKKEAEIEDAKEKSDVAPNIPRIKYQISAISHIEDGDPIFIAELVDATKNDEALRHLLEDPFKYGYSVTEDGFLKNQQGLVVVPNNREVRTKILQEIHDTPTGGHRGIEKTVNKLSKLFWWSGMKDEVQQYIGSCISCQSNKSTNRATPGLLHSLPIPTHPWESVSMDFVGPLPVTDKGNDYILNIVDRLTKMVHIIPCRVTVTATQVASLFWREVVRHHGIPSSIITDRDPRFTSRFWQELWRLVGTKLKMSTAYHPQTDGQTERMNRTIEEILRNYIKDNGEDWDQHLTAVEIAINTSKQSSTGMTPFRLNYGREMKLPLEHALQHLDSSNNPSASDSIKMMNDDLESARKNIVKAQQRQELSANQHRRLADDYKIGDRVMLTTENLSKLAGKLTSKWIGPFKVLDVSPDRTVTLELPSAMRLRSNKFNVSKVKLYTSSKLDFPNRVQLNRPPPDIVDGEEQYEIEEIAGKRSVRIGRGQYRTEYLVKWKGYPISESTWEAEEKLNNASEVVDEFEQQQ